MLRRRFFGFGCGFVVFLLALCALAMLFLNFFLHPRILIGNAKCPMKRLTASLILVLAVSTVACARGKNDSSAPPPILPRGATALPTSAEVRACPTDRPVKKITIIQENGGRVDWSPDGNLIVFDRQNADGYFDLYVMQPDGEIVTSLTERNSKINQRHNGNPAWHPAGKYIVFQSEEEKHYNVADQWPPDPGIGIYSNLYATTPDGAQFWRLTNIPIKQTLADGLVAMGVLNPRFSRDGKQLAWTERFADAGRWGKWRIHIADFVEGAAGPRLENDHVVLQPTGAMGAYMTAMAFSPDATKLLLAGNLDGQDEFGMDQYILDLKTGKWTNLQNTPTLWEEDASWSPDGARTVFMTNAGAPMDFNDPNWFWQKRTREFWTMDADGAHKQQLTCFNVPGAPEYIPQGAIVAHSAFSPDGKRLAGIVGVDYGTEDKADFKLKIALIEFK